MTATDFWSPALAPTAWPDECAPCTSRLWLPEGSAYAGASLGCIYDPEHYRAGGDMRHSNGEGGAYWTDAEAAEALTDRLASFAPADLQCTECPRPAVVGQLCQMCGSEPELADDRETESEAAA